jgi:hypothetical protein
MDWLMKYCSKTLRKKRRIKNIFLPTVVLWSSPVVSLTCTFGTFIGNREMRDDRRQILNLLARFTKDALSIVVQECDATEAE